MKRRAAVAALAVMLLALACWGAVRIVNRNGIPTAVVAKGEFVDNIEVRGEVKTLRSITLNAPSSAGDLQLVKLVANGTLVKAGDLVAQFDTTKLKQTLEERRAELHQAEAEIDRTQAQGRLREEQDRTELMQVTYDVERARLEASKQEILAPIEGQKNRLKLDDAEQKLRESEVKVRSNRIGAAADAESRQQKRTREKLDVDVTEVRIRSLTLLAPSPGVVTLLPNHRARTSMGGNAPEFKEGDRAWPGAAIAELPDLTAIQVRARVDEADRGRLKHAQTATIRVDAIPDRELVAQLDAISPLAKPDFSSWPVTKNFDVTLAVQAADPRMRPGMSATVRIAVERLANALLVPARACFEKNGRTVVYVRRPMGFEERALEVVRRSPTQLVVAGGLRAGERVATVDPFAAEHKERQER
jgi:HlyD family secretion protein